jgi:transposase-like protein
MRHGSLFAAFSANSAHLLARGAWIAWSSFAHSREQNNLLSFDPRPLERRQKACKQFWHLRSSRLIAPAQTVPQNRFKEEGTHSNRAPQCTHCLCSRAKSRLSRGADKSTSRPTFAAYRTRW